MTMEAAILFLGKLAALCVTAIMAIGSFTGAIASIVMASRYLRTLARPDAIEAKGPSPIGDVLIAHGLDSASEAFTAELLKSKAPDRRDP